MKKVLSILLSVAMIVLCLQRAARQTAIKARLAKQQMSK